MTDTVSTLAQKLRPFWLRDLGASAAPTTGATGMVAHALSGAYHSGTLAEAQAPWATTDTEFTGHTGDANAHHARAHAITSAGDHTVTGSQYQIVGLTGTNALGLLTPSAAPAANAVVKTDGFSAVQLVDLTITSDLFVNGYLDFGTDTITEDASYLQVAGAKPVRFGQNIGNANWTVYNAGGAQFGGSVDIIGGGDLTVGSNVLFVDNSAASVGVYCAPDPQFALDVNGPCRATYFVGPHAIQLKNVLLLAHFDGHYPYETNFTGDPNGHMGQVATVGGSVVFRPGKFYKALQTGPATTNRCTNPSFETNTTGWAYNDSNASGSMARSGLAYVGQYSLRLYNGSAGQDDYAYFTLAGLTANTAYTISAYAYVTDEFGGGALSNRGLFCYDSANVVGTQQYTTITGTTNGEWVRHVVTVTMTASPGNLWVKLYCPKGRTYWDAVQIEQASAATGYADGDMPGHTWAGTAHASNSSRSALASIAYATAGNIRAERGTVMAWIYPYGAVGTTYIWRVTGGVAGYIFLRTNGTNLEAYWGVDQITATGALTGNTWQHVAVTYDSATLRLYVNGVQVAQGTTSGFDTLPASMYVGSADGAGSAFPGLIDDFCTLPYVADADLIRSIVDSNAPVFAETARFSFRATPKQLIWADDEGLWMRDSAGSPVLGAYGGEAATKSWGGFTLAAGDIVLGSNAVGSAAILWDKSAGTFGFYGAGSGTPQVKIATDGTLMAGSGAVQLDVDGFHAFNAAAAEAVAIDSLGVHLFPGGARTAINDHTSGSRIRSDLAEIYEASQETYLDDAEIERTLFPLVVRAIRSGNEAALIELAAVRSDTGAGAKVIIGEGFRLKDYYSTYGNRVVHAKADSIILESSKLYLVGLTTNTTQSTGTGTLKLAGATNRNNTGFLQIYIGTTAVYVPYFTTITG